jgi:SAM-dependent methyltransferase
MRPEIIRQLLDLNASFYQTFASEFAATRQRIQPGVLRAVENYVFNPASDRLPGKILDLGCGNGELAAHLIRAGFKGEYLGLDFSQQLLDFARQAVQESLGESKASTINFRVANLAEPDLDLYLASASFDRIFAFAALHHLPGRENRLGLLQQVRAHLQPGGFFIHSEWQFRRSPRWLKRILPWEQVGLTDREVEPGDTLLDWRATGDKGIPGLRYVHYFTEEELFEDARNSGFRILDTYFSDGKEGDLGLYQIWKLME